MMILGTVTTRIEPWLVKSDCTNSSRRSSRIVASKISRESSVCKVPRLEPDVEYVACLSSHSFLRIERTVREPVFASRVRRLNHRKERQIMAPFSQCDIKPLRDISIAVGPGGVPRVALAARGVFPLGAGRCENSKVGMDAAGVGGRYHARVSASLPMAQNPRQGQR
jgi:hypothetical protein